MAATASEVLTAAVRAANDAADYALLERRANELLEHGRLARDRESVALAYKYIGNARLGMRDAGGAERAYRSCLEAYEAIGDALGAAIALANLGNLEYELRSNLVEARQMIESALPTIRAFGSAWNLAVMLGNLGEIARLEGDYDRSMLYAGEALDLFEDVADRTRAGCQLMNIAHCRILKRDFNSAAAVLGVAYAALTHDMNPRWIAQYFDIWFMFAVQRAQWERAGILLGFLEELRDSRTVPRLQNLMPWFSRSVEVLCANISEERLIELRHTGAALKAEQAQALCSEVGRSG